MITIGSRVIVKRSDVSEFVGETGRVSGYYTPPFRGVPQVCVTFDVPVIRANFAQVQGMFRDHEILPLTR